MNHRAINQTSETPPFVKAWLETEAGKQFLGSVIDGRVHVGSQLPGDDEEPEPCTVEVLSWDLFNERQVDRYWIRCNRVGPHLEHEDSNTGAHWTTRD